MIPNKDIVVSNSLNGKVISLCLGGEVSQKMFMMRSMMHIWLTDKINF